MQRMTLLEQRIMRRFPVNLQLWHQHSTTEPRAAMMKQIQRWLGQPSWPHQPIRAGQPDHSLTHAGHSLFALAMKGTGFCGVGIDYEPWRALDHRHHAILLTTRERNQMPAASADSARQLLRIWTIKEACFKADRGGQQRWVTAYELQQPTQGFGRARLATADGVAHFRYLSMDVADGALSVAIKMEN